MCTLIIIKFHCIVGKGNTNKLTDALFQLTGTCFTLRTNILTGRTERKTSGTTRSCIHTQQQSLGIPFQDYAVILPSCNTRHASPEEGLERVSLITKHTYPYHRRWLLCTPSLSDEHAQQNNIQTCVLSRAEPDYHCNDVLTGG